MPDFKTLTLFNSQKEKRSCKYHVNFIIMFYLRVYKSSDSKIKVKAKLKSGFGFLHLWIIVMKYIWFCFKTMFEKTTKEQNATPNPDVIIIFRLDRG